MIGTTLAHYEITARLGAGGMGEVWRATDTRLEREVALKLLPEEFANDPERMARFEREAKVLASLNHPNIATLYGLESVSGPNSKLKTQHSKLVMGTGTGTGAAVTFLVMELVEGEDLSERIARGPIPVDEAIPIAVQIAEGLEAAHEHEIVHRDLKPANIQLTPNGVIKILDFGLARSWGADLGDSSLSLSPTITKNATEAGMILGTAAYMSPEQARGKKVDKKTDIWAFGVVLWEMLTGRKLFEGETVSDVLAAVLRADPDWDELPLDTTPALRRLLERCLARDPRLRLHDAADARLEIETAREELLIDSTGDSSQSAASRFWARLPWSLAGFLAVLLVLSTTVLREQPEPVRPVVATLQLPEDLVYHWGAEYAGSLAVSPDGTRLVLSAARVGELSRLWLLSLDSTDAIPLPGTEQANYPFWSPDSRWIAFFAGGKLKKIGLTGSPPQVICEAPNGRPGSWNEDDVIIFSPETITGVHRVSATGGEPEAVTRLDERLGETTHRWASFLPDGRRFLYLAAAHDLARDAEANALCLGDLESESRRRLLPLRSAAVFDSGHLLYYRDGVLVAHPFDPDRLAFKGDPFSVSDDVAYASGFFQASFATAHGILVLRHEGRAVKASLKWVDRQGAPLDAVGGKPLTLMEPAPKRFASDFPAALSPDDSCLLCILENEDTGAQELWMADLESGLWSKFSSGWGGEGFGVWSPDGERVAYDRYERAGKAYEIVIAEADSPDSGHVRLRLDGGGTALPMDWSPDGRHLLYTRLPSTGSSLGGDIWVVPTDGEEEPVPFFETEHNATGAWFSPEGRWVLYITDDSGTDQAFVRPFSGPGGARLVSNDEVYWGWWRTPSEILLMRPDGGVVAVEVSASEGVFHVGSSKKLLHLNPLVIGEPSHDGSRFVVAAVPEDRSSGQFTLMVNWRAALAAAER